MPLASFADIRCALAALVVVIVSGCFQPPPPVPPKVATTAPAQPAAAGQPPAGNLSAGEILKRLLKTYRSAETYSDQGVVKLEFSQAGTKAGDQWPSAVQFRRPSKLSVAAFQATIKCDSRELTARIEDPATANLDGQVLVRALAGPLKLADLASDELLYNTICGQLGRQPIQLELLLESSGLATAFEADVACQRLDDAQTDGRDCFRVAVPSPGGSFVFWVDKSDFLLRRLDYPVAALRPDLASDPSLTDLRLSAELIGAKIGGPLADDVFTLTVPATVKRMKSFVRPVQPLPSQLFGKQPAEFYFTDLAGERVGSRQLADKIAVLIWYHDDPACEATLQQVAAAKQRLEGDASVAFYAVATDPTSASNDELTRKLAAWQVKLSIVRDLAAFGKSAFQIEFHPTLVVLDGQGRVQIFQPGGNPHLADQIVQIVQRLKMGTDLAAEIVSQYQRERKQYDELLARGGPEPGQVIELPEAFIRQRSTPKTLKLNELWTCREVKSPGNFLLMEAPDKPTRIFVSEGWRTMTELTSDGQVAARHELELPERAAITFARAATDKDGHPHYVAGAPLAGQFFLFDEQWKLVSTYPATDQTPLALTDLAFADLGGDGWPAVLAGNAGDIGLVAIGLDGKVAWRNSTFPNVLSVAVSRPNDVGSWAIYLAGERGTVLRVNRFGRDEPQQAVGRWPIGRVLAARFADATQAAFLGLSNNDKGEPFAVGIGLGAKDQLAEVWNYPLPPGLHQRPIEAVTSSHLLAGRKGEWWLAGPDGSIHVVSEDGELHDSFYYGAALTGLAATQLDKQPVLLVATEEGVTAWRIEQPSPMRSPPRVR